MKEMFALQVNARDNVAVVLSGDVAAGDSVTVRDHQGGTRELRALNGIPYGHKIALAAMEAGDRIVKYGEVIGAASGKIAPGEHVHVHNMESLRGRGDWEK